MFDFFFDSADTDFIKSTWEQIKDFTKPEHVRGITTNPKAMFRVDAHTLEQWKAKTLELCETVSEIRGGPGGVVYVQFPNCDASVHEAIEFAEIISGWGDGTTKIGMKIPPYKNYLKMTPLLERHVETNVTGIADCSTALFCSSYDVRYVSIIPGRMEEVGIDSDPHLSTVTNSDMGRTEVIAGSMRTIDGLHRSVLLGTVPTIGSTVFKLVLEDPQNALSVKKDLKVSENAYLTGEVNHDLSKSFFVEMNGLAETAYKGFKKEQR